MRSAILAALLLGAGSAISAKAPSADPRVVSGHAALGFDLLHQLATKPGENVFISPTSIASALEMTYNGAASSTKAEMARTLHIDGLDLETVNASNEALRLGATGADPKVKIAIANSLWAQKGFPFLPAFTGRNNRYYAAEVQNVVFGPPATTKRINAWVEVRTNGKIKDLLTSLDDKTRLVLVNAVYFHGLWTEPFKKTATRPQPFSLQNGSVRNVPMMFRTGHYSYLKGDGFQAIRLPYGSGRFAMYVYLPDTPDGLPELVKKVTATDSNGWIKEMHSAEVVLGLPRFKVEYSKALNDPLVALGMRSAFTDADFPGMTGKRDLYISLVQHKAFVDVNEEGTEAAAATAVVIRATAMMPTKQIVMTVDHPFLCAIRDDQTGEILFLGAIYNPS